MGQLDEVKNKIEVDFKSLPPDVRAWVEFEVMASNAHDIRVNILKKRQVLMDNVRVSGFFCSHTDRLFVAGLSPDWVPIMVHETCHRDQYTEQIKIWNDTISIKGEEHDPLTLMHEWLEGKRELGQRKLREVLWLLNWIVNAVQLKRLTSFTYQSISRNTSKRQTPTSIFIWQCSMYAVGISLEKRHLPYLKYGLRCPPTLIMTTPDCQKKSRI